MKLLVVKEVADILRVSVEHVRRLIRSGQLSGFKLGRRGGYRIREEDLKNYIMKRSNERGKREGGAV